MKLKPAYFQSQYSGRDRWMVSYLDVLTIVLILFVAMAAQALQSAPKKPDLALTPVAASLIPAPSALSEIKQELEQNHLDVQLDSRGVVVSLPQRLLFPPGEDRINADALATVAAIGDELSKIPNHVSLVGHADAVPVHNRRFSNNWELAAARGLRLLELFHSRYGIAETRFSVESYGSTDPKSTNDTPGGRASNRRVEIVILDSAPRATP
jgi:outer membrane protein OmpA-like peptidoglycan-associated protein